MGRISRRLQSRLSKIAIFVILAVALPVSGVHASPVIGQQSAKGLAAAVQADPLSREVLYQSMTFDVKDWRAGKIVSWNPYAVVGEFDVAKEFIILRVWTGDLRREGNDLYTTWDEVWMSLEGKVDFSILLDEEKVTGYFSGDEAGNYFVTKHLKSMPWIDIPTDPEAKMSNVSQIPGGKELNVYRSDEAASYGIAAFKEELPDRVPGFKKGSIQTHVSLPSDSVKHWSKAYITDLMQKGIIEGFEDGTIRPDSKLTRSQFVALLARSIGLKAQSGGANVYTDLQGHWAEGLIRSAQQAGIVTGNPAALEFQPNVTMTRSDMIELAANAIVTSHIPTRKATLAFTDIKLMAHERIEALEKVVGAGLISGYPDGSFKPNGYLTRAEAFKVISQLMAL